MAARNNPGGGKGQDKEWADALRIAVNEKAEGGGKKLRQLATRVVDEAIGGNITAAKEIGDRLDGKATQAVDMKVTGLEPIEEIRQYVQDGERPRPRLVGGSAVADK